MIQIYLTQNQFCLIDDADYERVSRYKWHLHVEKKSGLYYARTSIGGFKVNLGRFLLNLGDSPLTCDHKNGQTLDYRRCNLRKINMIDNIKNREWRKKRKYKIPSLHEIMQSDIDDIPFMLEA